MEKKYKEKNELPVYVVAILIFFSSLAFLGFAVYYIAFLPVPMIMQPLRIRLLTSLQAEDAARKIENNNELEEDFFEEKNNDEELED